MALKIFQIMSIRQPNKEQYEKAMNSFKQEMDSIKEKLDKISIPKDEFGQEKQEKRAIFQTLLKQKQEAQAKKSSVLNQMKQLQVIVKAQGESVQKELEKLGYKTPEEIQTRVKY
jgi:ribosomal protein S4